MLVVGPQGPKLGGREEVEMGEECEVHGQTVPEVSCRTDVMETVGENP